MQKSLLIVAILLTTHLSANSVETVKSKIAITKAKVTRSYNCWKYDGYYPIYTTVNIERTIITIKTFKKCEVK